MQGPDLGCEGAGVSLSLPVILARCSWLLPIPGELQPSIHAGDLTWLCFPKNCSCPQDPSHGASRALQVCPGVQLLQVCPGVQLLQVCPGVQLLLFLNSQSTCNSLLRCSCSPVLPLAPGISPGIKLVRLGWIQVLQVWIPLTHLGLPALPWAGIHGTPSRPSWDLSWGETSHFWGFSLFHGFSQVRSTWGGAGEGNWDVGWGCLLCWLCPGDWLTWTLLDSGICSPAWDCAPKLHSAHLDPADCGICSPGPCRLWDLLTWICSPGSAHLDPADCGICSPGSAHLDLLTWTLQTVGSAHLDPADCGICSPGSAHLDPADCGICSPGPAHVVGSAHLDLLT
ncbi:uncharacterized protein LOC134413767 [Melospiza melodia melodia]|uniref:uncharacterized protein LOC134413767 n=1 Tax=Melospiza melodia melodia TaxID=1914991 RepID=UPI002FD1E8A6